MCTLASEEEHQIDGVNAPFKAHINVFVQLNKGSKVIK